MTEPFGRITANLDVIYPRYDPANFVGRGWLVDEVISLRGSRDRRHLVIVGEPGTGKSAFIAYLAEAWNCPRHFIRVDSVSGVTGLDPRGFILSLGSQIFEKYGAAIFESHSSINAHVSVGLVKDQAEIVGQMIDELYSPLPFLQPVEQNINIKVGIATGRSRVIGQRIVRLVNIAYKLDPTTLLDVAVLQPLRNLQKIHPDEIVMVLVDALDESIGHTDVRVIDLIPRSSDSGMPSNLRFVMTSRPGDHLAPFRKDDMLFVDNRQAGYYQNNLKDARRYIEKRLHEEPLAATCDGWSELEKDEYIETVLEHSAGNFLFLFHFFNQLAEAVSETTKDLRIIAIPRGLDEIYRYFAVEKIRGDVLDDVSFIIRGRVTKKLISTIRSLPGVRNMLVDGQVIWLKVDNINQILGPLMNLRFRSAKLLNLTVEQGTGGEAWENRYLHILGILAVAREALTVQQIAAFAGVPISYVARTITRLLQFLGTISSSDKVFYRLFHPSFGDYLLDATRNRDYPISGPAYHNRIAMYYRQGRETWSTVDWDVLNEVYPYVHLGAHLVAAGKKDELYELIDSRYFEAHLRQTQSLRTFAEHLDLCLQVARTEDHPNLVQIVRSALAFAKLGDMSSLLAPELLGILARIGEPDRAQGYAALIQDPQRKCEAYKQIALAHIDVGRLRDANTLLREAAKQTKLYWNGLDQRQEMVEISEAFLQTQDEIRAGQLAEQAFLLGQSAELAQRQALSLLLRTHHVKLALSLVDHLDDPPDRATLYAVAVHTFTEMKEFTLAAEAKQKIVGLLPAFENEALHLLACVRSAHAFIECADLEEAARVTIHTYTNAKQAVTDPNSMVDILIEIADILLKLGNEPLARDTIDQALVWVSQLDFAWTEAISLTQIAVLFVRLGLNNEATKTSNKAFAIAMDTVRNNPGLEPATTSATAAKIVRSTARVQLVWQPSLALVLRNVSNVLNATSGTNSVVEMVMKAANVAEGLNGTDDAAYLLSVLAAILALNNDISGAERLIELSLARTLVQSPDSRFIFRELLNAAAVLNSTRKLTIHLAEKLRQVIRDVELSSGTWTESISLGETLWASVRTGRFESITSVTAAMIREKHVWETIAILSTGYTVERTSTQTEQLDKLLQGLMDSIKLSSDTIAMLAQDNFPGSLKSGVSSHIADHPLKDYFGGSIHILNDLSLKIEAGSLLSALIGNLANIGNQSLRRRLVKQVFAQVHRLASRSSDIGLLLKLAISLSAVEHEALSLRVLDRVIALTDNNTVAIELLPSVLLSSMLLVRNKANARALGVVANVLASAKRAEHSADQLYIYLAAADVVNYTGDNSQAALLANKAINIALSLDDEIEKGLLLSIAVSTVTRVAGAERAIQLAKLVQNPRDRNSGFTSIAATLVEIGREQFLSRVMDGVEAVEGSWKVNEWYRGVALGEVAILAAFARQKEEVNRALGLAQDITLERTKDVSLGGIIPALGRVGEVETALRIAEGMHDIDRKAFALSRLALTLLQVGDSNNATLIANRAVRLTVDPRWLKWIIADVMDTLIGSRELQMALSVANECGDYSDRATALSLVATALAKSGQIHHAQKVFCDALCEARLVDSTSVINTVKEGMNLIAMSDSGQLLWHAYLAIMDIYHWRQNGM